jgi:hypothetical protein
MRARRQAFHSRTLLFRMALGVGATLAFVALALPAFAFASTMTLPDITGLSSPTHPSDTTWYPTRSVSFSWEATRAFDGYSFAFDGAATAPTLDMTRDGLMPRFSEGASTPVGPTEPWAMPRFGYQAVADFNGDGILDLAEAGGTRLYVLLGKGDGTFETKVQPPSSNPYLFLTGNGYEYESRELVAADFDLDGETDLALVGHSPAAEYLVLKGVGDGTFTISWGAASGWTGDWWTSPWITGRSITTADFDANGTLDLAASLESSPGVVVVYPGNTDGTFGAGTPLRVSGTITAADVVRDLATGDLDADGRPELVGVLGGDATARTAIWHNVGGTLTTPSALNVPGAREHSKVEVAEMDGDGAPEIVAASKDSNYFQSGVTIYHGNLAGGFTATGLMPLDHEDWMDLKVVDINADGLLDVVGLNAYAYNSEGRAGVEWYLNDGSGGFTGPFRHRSYDNSVQQFSVGDFDGNGLVDFVVCPPPDSSFAGPGARVVPILASAGVDVVAPSDGTFYFHVRGVSGGTGGAASDLRVRIDTTGPAVSLTGISDGGIYVSGSIPPASIVASDPNMPDASGVAAVHWSTSFGTSGETAGDSVPVSIPTAPGVYIYTAHAVDNAGNQGIEKTFAVTVLGDVLGLASPTHPLATTWYPATTAGFRWDERPGVEYSYQLDRDPNGAPDLVADPFASRGSMLMPPASYPASASIGPLATGDFNGDGKADIAAGENDGTGVRILLNHGDGTFPTGGPDHYYDTGTYPTDIHAVDLDNDKKLDLVFGNGSETSSLGIMRGNGDGTFRPMEVVGLPSSDAVSLAVADYDRDGRLEIACGGWDSTVDIVYWSGTSWALRHVTLPDGAQGIGSIATGDFNGDGRPDLVLGNDASELVVALNEGAGLFPGSAISTEPVSASANELAVADLDRDGRADVVVNAYGSSKLITLDGDGTGAFSGEHVLDISGSADVTLGDFNRDGVLDLARWLPGWPTMQVFTGDGAGSFTGPVANTAAAQGAYGVASADFDGDGFADVAAADWDGKVEIFRGWDRRSNVTFTGLATGTWYFHVREVGPGAGARVSTIRINIATPVPAKGRSVGAVRFGPNTYRLNAWSKAALRKLAIAIKVRGYKTVTVEGWTAHRDRGSSSFRRRLSAARARSVKAYLDSRFRVLKVKVRVVAVGKGAVPGSRDGTSLDRKVVIWAK